MTDIVVRKSRGEMTARIRGRDTVPELTARLIFHRMSLRFYLQCKDLSGRSDLDLPKHRPAAFVHGCFWHRHERCRYSSTTKSRIAFWVEKVETNVVRDGRQGTILRVLGWRILVISRCETMGEVVVGLKLSALVDRGEVADERGGTPAVATIETQPSTPGLQSGMLLLPVSERSDAGLCAVSASAPDYGDRM